MAFRPAVFDFSASGDDESDVLLGDHPPEISIGIFEGALTGDYLAIVETEWTIDEVRIDVPIDLCIARSKPFSRDQVYTGVLERSDI